MTTAILSRPLPEKLHSDTLRDGTSFTFSLDYIGHKLANAFRTLQHQSADLCVTTEFQHSPAIDALAASACMAFAIVRCEREQPATDVIMRLKNRGCTFSKSISAQAVVRISIVCPDRDCEVKPDWSCVSQRHAGQSKKISRHRRISNREAWQIANSDSHDWGEQAR